MTPSRVNAATVAGALQTRFGLTTESAIRAADIIYLRPDRDALYAAIGDGRGDFDRVLRWWLHGELRKEKEARR